jgi:hypothetical protein
VPSQREDLIGKPCDGSWLQTTLGPNNKFFNFDDIKPGDNGEDTISLHVSNNSWICANITTTSNNDNTVTPPEIAAGDDASSTVGELAQNTYVFGWVDNASSSDFKAGDNKWERGEQVLFGPIPLSSIVGSSSLILPLADSQHGSALIASTTNYIGVAWCTGTMDVSVPGVIKCDGSTLGNIIQTDSATADVTLTATQSRNNPSFLCGSSTPTTTLTVIKTVVGTTSVASSAFTIHVKNASSTDIAGSPQPGSSSGTTYSGLAAGAYTVSENATPGGFNEVISGDCAADGTITLANGDNKTCTITNIDPGKSATGTLVVTKVVVGSTTPPSAFTIHIETPPGGADAVTPFAGSSSGTSKSLAAGTYVVDEDATPPGFVTTFSGGCSATSSPLVGGAVTVVGGATSTCTITNTDKGPAPKLTVTKVVVNDNGGTSTISSFPLFVDGASVTSGVATTTSAGAHLVSETGATGYQSKITGDCAADGTITLANGDNKHCTITNDDIAPTITLTKVIVNTGGGTVTDPAAFGIKIDGSPVSSGSTTSVSAGGTGHIISENATSTYTGTMSGNVKCPSTVGSSTAPLNLAENISCTITNTFN